MSFGAAVSSDAGVIGTISLDQRNFDLFDVPTSLDDWLNGRAFRGAGQQFNVTVAPGDEVSTYSISLADPAIFDTDYSGSISAPLACVTWISAPCPCSGWPASTVTDKLPCAIAHDCSVTF